ncbi:MAG TPA: polysaccharide deacetylase family protein [Baekduia sp.]|uniref:polysaccharide deacetylase family protein n=1 Tax=Baekduia sp. TaxID=2600305 RepID=UPI002D15F128|nr:polysaccharide deacetylase family protein [Baekduia sp.]HMJ36313.1 polysaccharide deacetylase family protein [Baekduia sp.]
MRARTALTLGTLGAAAGRVAPALAPHIPSVARGLGLPRRLDLPGAVALTFDDGPHTDGTPAVLEILREHRVAATFFVVGEQVRRTGALIDEIRAAGHAVALHGDRHRTLLRLPARALREDLDRLTDTLGDDTVPAHRAPYGAYTRSAIAEVRRRGWVPLLWSRWGRDWRARATPAGVAAEVTRDLGAGDVLLLHDADDYSAPGSWRTTVAALPAVLDAIAAAGLRTAPVRPEGWAGGSTAGRTSGARPPSR